MSEQAEPWFNSEGYFAHTMEGRVAAELGQAMIAGIAAKVRLEMADARDADARGRLAEISAEVERLRHDHDIHAKAADHLGRALDEVPPKHLPAWFVAGETPPERLPQDAEPVSEPAS